LLFRERQRRLLRAMVRLLLVLLRVFRSALRSHADLMLENLALRQQLAAFVQSGRRPRIRATDRLLWIALRRVWSRWTEVLLFVNPETVVRWHRAGFRLYWAWLSRRRRRPGRPPIDRGIRDLIRRMATANPTWGAPRIHGELLMLGFDVSERTVSRYLPRRPPGPDAVARWLVFLRNHRDVIAAMDFFVGPTVTFRMLYVWFAIEHGRRRVLRFDVTDHPAAAWVIHQLRETFPFDTAPRHLIFDRDSTFSAEVVATVRSFGMTTRTRRTRRQPEPSDARRRPDRRPRIRRRGVRRFRGDEKFGSLLREYRDYFNESRPHQGLGQRRPAGGTIYADMSKPIAIRTVLGGLHADYRRAA
jgi:putative transposase